LHYLAGQKDFNLSPVICNRLTEVIEGYTGRCDEKAARRGIEWMRDRYLGPSRGPAILKGGLSTVGKRRCASRAAHDIAWWGGFGCILTIFVTVLQELGGIPQHLRSYKFDR
jgi:hypothetical protein